MAEQFRVRIVPSQVPDPVKVSGTLKVPLTLNAPNETYEQPESFRLRNLFVRMEKKMDEPLYCDRIRNRPYQFQSAGRPCGLRSNGLAILLRPRFSDAVNVWGVPATNRFFYWDEFWLALQPRAARDVIHLIIVIDRYGDRPGNQERFRSARRTLMIVRRDYQLSSREQRESKRQGCSRSERPSQKGPPRTIRLFSQPFMQPFVETTRRSQHSLIAVEGNYIAHAIKKRGAMTALGKMLIEGSSLERDEILIHIV
ncbi:MAG TPA: hypothetical protein VFI45_09545 [Candidatus Acidoferrum sp.]|nr:hypothetical protein [Candidatus Acidoferrum sp.]